MEPSICNETNSTNVSASCVQTKVAGATIVSPLVMFMIGVVGNVVALCTLHTSKNNTRTSKFYILISGLAWTDLLGIVLTTPSTISAYVNGRKWVGGEAHCFYQGFAMTCAGLSTTFIICAISVERFLALKCVFFYSSRCTHGTTRCVIAALWISVIWFGLLPLFGFGKYELQYPGTWCFLDFHSRNIVENTYAYIYASVNCVLLFTMLSCNGYVVFTLSTLRWRQGSQHDVGKRESLLVSQNTDWTTSTGYRPIRKKHRSVDIQMIVLMCAITTTFFICWAPLMIQIIVTIATNRPNYLWDLTAIRLASINQLLDPWLYILLRKSIFEKIRNTCGKVWSKLCCCLQRNDRGAFEEMVNILAVDMKHDQVVNVNKHKINKHVYVRHVNAHDNIPDVSRINVIHGGKRLSPLPDVTQTGRDDENNISDHSEIGIDILKDNTNSISDKQRYVCSLELGNVEQNNDIGSVYIKVLFLNGECCDPSKNEHTCPRLHVTRTTSCLGNISSDQFAKSEHSSSSIHNAQCVSNPLQVPKPEADSEEFRTILGENNAISLRRTKSNI